VKGGSSIVTLKFIGTGVASNMQACVKIYDINDNLLYEKETFNGELKVSLEENKVYRLFAISCNDIISAAFYVSKCKKKYVFIFNRSIYNSELRTITFLLKDANYSNLPIGEGELVIWQK